MILPYKIVDHTWFLELDTTYVYTWVYHLLVQGYLNFRAQFVPPQNNIVPSRVYKGDKMRQNV